MKTGPRPKGRPWTPEEDAQLLALLESKTARDLIARKLKRTVMAVSIRLRMTVPNQLERQLMQELRGAGWVKGYRVATFPRTIEGLLSKGWIERRGGGNDTCYRITDEGLGAKMASLRIYN